MGRDHSPADIALVGDSPGGVQPVHQSGGVQGGHVVHGPRIRVGGPHQAPARQDQERRAKLMRLINFTAGSAWQFLIVPSGLSAQPSLRLISRQMQLLREAHYFLFSCPGGRRTGSRRLQPLCRTRRTSARRHWHPRDPRHRSTGSGQHRWETASGGRQSRFRWLVG